MSWSNQRSFGEKILESVLLELRIQSRQQLTFSDCRSPKGAKLRFDFILFKNDKPWIAIECQGQQHSSPYKQYEYVQECDRIKREWCVAHNIPLIEIPYEEYGDISVPYIRKKLKQIT